MIVFCLHVVGLGCRFTVGCYVLLLVIDDCQVVGFMIALRGRDRLITSWLFVFWVLVRRGLLGKGGGF